MTQTYKACPVVVEVPFWLVQRAREWAEHHIQRGVQGLELGHARRDIVLKADEDAESTMVHKYICTYASHVRRT